MCPLSSEGTQQHLPASALLGAVWTLFQEFEENERKGIRLWIYQGLKMHLFE
ncbi:hypothetical protein HMPREF1546_03303 [Oscillibacter sp. KLE 1745]|nr:hypothetical protein HMPREF1546_03303 [Oscillibacter sp. KLE 1745]